MCWSDPSIAKHYTYVTDQLMTAITHDVSELLWPSARRATETGARNADSLVST